MPRTPRQLPVIDLPSLGFIALNLVSMVVFAQSELNEPSDEALDNLVFDPVLLEEGEAVVATENLAPARLAFPEPESESGFDTTLTAVPAGRSASIASYLGDIAELERREGQYAPALMENLMALGNLYQQQDEHEQAIASFERAGHISRINYGLYHEGQIVIVENLIESYLAVNDFSAVNDKQRYLSFLKRKLLSNGSLARVPTLAGLADGNMTTFGLALAEPPASVGLPYDDDKLQTLSSGTPEAARYYAISSLYRARNNYSAAISTLIDNGNFLHPRLLELEYKFLETLFLSGYSSELLDNPHYYLTSARVRANLPNRWTYLRRNTEGYETGIRAFERILAYLDGNPAATASQQVRARIELGDWHLVYGWEDAAKEAYGSAYAQGQAMGLAPDTLADLFAPAFPVQLPVFTAKPNSREKFAISPDTQLAHDGYIDVTFAINSNGTAGKIRLLDKSPGTSYAVEALLQRYLRNSPFRPRVVAGKTEDRDAVSLRYYYTFL